MKLKIFAEIGYGNSSFCSTEIEKGKFEHRVRGFIIPNKITGIYIRVWIGKRVYALSSNRFFNTTKKDRAKFKFIFGIEGRREE
jgi:hypothetical protein